MVPQWVTASQARIAKHTGTADALLGSVRPGKVVSRRDLASVVGKYQFLAPLVKGVQNMLVPAYRARDRFTAPVVETWDPAQRWGPEIDVTLGLEARAGSESFAGALRRGPVRRAPELWSVCERMFRAADEFDLELAAEHILGVENTLSDGLSRYVRRKDYSYWQFRRDEFLSVQDLFTRLFTLDGGAHPVGTNAHLPRYWSVVDGFEDTPVDG
eukprot:gene12198-biopygen12549